MTEKLDAGTGGSIEALLEHIEKFIDQTPLQLGWRIAEQVESHNSVVVDREYVEWLHVRSFLRELLNGLTSIDGIYRDQSPGAVTAAERTEKA